MSTNLSKIRVALDMLRTARRLLKEAGATRALEKTRAAIKSAEGAERHAFGLQGRSQRDEIVMVPRKFGATIAGPSHQE